jgi:prepilin-type N-terminal cleavage/methylation domain-containing protein
MIMCRFISHKAMTLIEVLVSVFILTVGILGALLFLTRAMTASKVAKDLTVATTHAEYVMEEIRGRQNFFSITSENWALWAQNQGLNALPEERVAVRCDNPGQDPIKIQTIISWNREGRESQIVLATELTK